MCFIIPIVFMQTSAATRELVSAQWFDGVLNDSGCVLRLALPLFLGSGQCHIPRCPTNIHAIGSCRPCCRGCTSSSRLNFARNVQFASFRSLRLGIKARRNHAQCTGHGTVPAELVKASDIQKYKCSLKSPRCASRKIIITDNYKLQIHSFSTNRLEQI